MANNKTSAGKIVVGVGLAAAAAAAYYFFGKGGRQHRKQIAGWTRQAKQEIVQKMKRMKTLSRQAYNKASREVLAKYKKIKNIQPGELAELGRELRDTWDRIADSVSSLGEKKTLRTAGAK